MIGTTTNQWPCDMGTGTPVGYHHFEAGPTGVICCRWCGATPKNRWGWNHPQPGLPEVYG